MAVRYNVTVVEMWEYLAMSLQLESMLDLLHPELHNSSVALFAHIEQTLKDHSNGSLDIEAMVQEASYTLDDMVGELDYCYWAGLDMMPNCGHELWTSMITIYGTCYSIGYNASALGRPFYQNRAGSGSGFSLAIDIHHEEYSGIVYHLECLVKLQNKVLWLYTDIIIYRQVIAE